MKTYTKVNSTVSPLKIDKDSSPTTVYIRNNIKEVIVDKHIYFEYDEIQYSKEEYEKIELNNAISSLKQENADLLLDSAIKDARIQQTEKDIADIMLEITGGM